VYDPRTDGERILLAQEFFGACDLEPTMATLVDPVTTDAADKAYHACECKRLGNVWAELPRMIWRSLTDLISHCHGDTCISSSVSTVSTPTLRTRPLTPVSARP
jgi:hypothetical protein